MVDRRNQQLQGPIFCRRFGDVCDDSLEEGLERIALVGERSLRNARLGIGEQHGKVGLLVVGAEFDEEVERLVDNVLRARLFAIDLIDDDDGAQIEFERLAKHEASLRHDALCCVYEQQHALHHLQDALDFTAEIGVAGRVHDVELNAPVANRGVLSENGNAALALERIGIHHPRCDLLAFAEDAALLEHRIDQRRFAVVDVRNDGDVTNVGPCFHRGDA